MYLVENYFFNDIIILLEKVTAFIYRNEEIQKIPKTHIFTNTGLMSWININWKLRFLSDLLIVHYTYRNVFTYTKYWKCYLPSASPYFGRLSRLGRGLSRATARPLPLFGNINITEKIYLIVPRVRKQNRRYRRPFHRVRPVNTGNRERSVPFPETELIRWSLLNAQSKHSVSRYAQQV